MDLFWNVEKSDEKTVVNNIKGLEFLSLAKKGLQRTFYRTHVARVWKQTGT